MKRRYLNGMDWVIHSLDYDLRQKTGCGNISQVVLELENRPDEEALQNGIAALARQFPLVCGKTGRDYNLCPCWKTGRRHKTLPLELNVCARPDAFNLLAEIGNRPFRDKREHLTFNLVYGQDVTYFSMVFDHRLLDAYGAEIFLTTLQTGNFPGEVDLFEPAHLNRWPEKFRAGQNVNRALRHFAEKGYCLLAPGITRWKNRVKFRTICFSEPDSRHIIEAAEQKAGYLMFMPYVLTLCLQGIGRIFKERGCERGDYVIPVSIDTREADAPHQKMFFNHFSFLFFRFSPAELASSTQLLQSAKRQMYEQTKNGLSEDLRSASFLLRIAPLPLLGRLLKPPNSCSFACINRTCDIQTFYGSRVQNLFHLPRVPLPPGIGLFINRFQQKINLTITCYDNILSDSEADALVSDLKFLLPTG